MMNLCFLTCSSKNNLFYSLVVLVLYGLISGCNQNQGRPAKEDIIAKYNQEVLLREEIDFFIPDSLSTGDSTLFAQKYIDEWVESQVIREAALKEVSQLDNKIKYKLKAYEYKLMEHEFASWLIEDKSDRLEVSEADIRNYYNKYPEKFVSGEPYYQYFYVKTKLAKQYNLVNLMQSQDREKIDELVEWSKENAEEYLLDSTYVPEAELTRISDGFYFGNIRRASKSTTYPYQHNEGDTTYYDFFRLIDDVNAGDIMPLSLVRDRIENILRNQLKNTLIEKTETDLIQQAKAAKKVIVSP
ncbi:MAG: hypothetical protein KDD99_06395 [Bacteroidetes bacterium]|nr:hypothetical protein [Bacteroidota bacterium]